MVPTLKTRVWDGRDDECISLTQFKNQRLNSVPSGDLDLIIAAKHNRRVCSLAGGRGELLCQLSDRRFRETCVIIVSLDEHKGAGRSKSNFL